MRLTADDQISAAALRASRRLDIDELRSGLRIRSRGWIGVVRLQSCTICVRPTLIDGHRSLVKLLQYVRRIDLMRPMRADAPFIADGVDLFDLMALLLAQACDKVLQMGPQADYVRQHEELPVMRGRLDVKDQALRRFGRVDTLICEFDERVHDIPENRWLIRALRVARRRVDDPRVLDHVRRTSSAWEELCDDDVSEPLQKPELTRSNHHYGNALSLAYLVLDGVSASDLLSSGHATGFSYMLSMPRLFEEFVSCLLERLATAAGCRTVRQSSDPSVLWRVESSKSFGSVRPDLLLERPGGRVRLPVDAKYKPYGGKKLKPSDVYQGAIYALTLAKTPSLGGVPTCVLLHPCSTGMALRQRVQVRVDKVGVAEVVAMGIHVDHLLDNGGASMAREPWYTTITGLLAPAEHLA